MSQFKPMLASPADLKKLAFPQFASRKLDGIRCVIRDGVALTRSLKPIRNAFIQSRIAHLEGLDGELIVGPANAENVYRITNSGVMSSKGEPRFTFWVFDRWDMDKPYFDRLLSLDQFEGQDHVEVLPHTLIKDLDHLNDYEEAAVSDGYEGVMLRNGGGLYKYGRSTVKEGHLLKLKRWNDSEMYVTQMVERMHNANEATTNELGRTQRSTAKSGLVPMNTMGTLIGVDIHSGVTVEVGTGFSDKDRAWFWAQRESPTSMPLIKYKCVQSTGGYDKPRHAVFNGLRDSSDI